MYVTNEAKHLTKSLNRVYVRRNAKVTRFRLNRCMLLMRRNTLQNFSDKMLSSGK